LGQDPVAGGPVQLPTETCALKIPAYNRSNRAFARTSADQCDGGRIEKLVEITHRHAETIDQITQDGALILIKAPGLSERLALNRLSVAIPLINDRFERRERHAVVGTPLGASQAVLSRKIRFVGPRYAALTSWCQPGDASPPPAVGSPPSSRPHERQFGYLSVGVGATVI
jgi:hypothetical protein